MYIMEDRQSTIDKDDCEILLGLQTPGRGQDVDLPAAGHDGMTDDHRLTTKLPLCLSHSTGV